LKNYVWARLLWDPTRDVDALIDEFCRGYYGPAAAEMLAYVNLLEDSVRGDPPISADEFNDRWPWMTPELVAEAQSLFERALAKTKDDGELPYYRRVREAQVSLEAWLLWKPGPLEEQGERLIRADLAEDTYARAEQLIEYCRDASPVEWGNGIKYRMQFLAMQGGPMPILTEGPLAVKVAPVQDGRLRGILYGDKVAVDESHVRLAVGSVTYQLTGHENNRVEMAADLGVTMWGPANQNQTGYQTLVLGDGVLRCTGELERRSAKASSNQAFFETIYKVGKHPEQLLIEYQDEAGQWQAARVGADQPQAALPTASRLRITRTDRGLRVDDRYDSPFGTPSGDIEFDAKSGEIKLTVDTHPCELAAQGRTVFAHREIRVEPVKP